MPTEDRLLTRGIFQNTRAGGKGAVKKHTLAIEFSVRAKILAIAAIAGSMQADSVLFCVNKSTRYRCIVQRGTVRKPAVERCSGLEGSRYYSPVSATDLRPVLMRHRAPCEDCTRTREREYRRALGFRNRVGGLGWNGSHSRDG